MKKYLHWYILGSLALAVIVGQVCRQYITLESEALAGVLTFSQFLGGLFLKALKMVIVPLVASSVIAGILGVGKIEGFARLGVKTLIGYTLTSCLAIVIGLTCVNLIQPGTVNGERNLKIEKIFQESQISERVETMSSNTEKVKQTALERFQELANRMISSNIFSSASDNGNLLSVIFFCLLFAIAAVSLPANQQGSLALTFEAIQNTMVKITEWERARRSFPAW